MTSSIPASTAQLRARARWASDVGHLAAMLILFWSLDGLKRLDSVSTATPAFSGPLAKRAKRACFATSGRVGSLVSLMKTSCFRGCTIRPTFPVRSFAQNGGRVGRRVLFDPPSHSPQPFPVPKAIPLEPERLRAQATHSFS